LIYTYANRRNSTISVETIRSQGHWANPERRLPDYLTTGTVLAIAAGSANLWLADQGFTVTALEEQPAIIEEAKERGLPITFLPDPITDFSPAPHNTYDAVVVLGRLHFRSRERLAALIEQLQHHTRAGGIHIIRSSGEPSPRPNHPAKTALVPWLDWYTDWRIIEFMHRDGEVRSRYVESPHWLFDHYTLLIAENEPPHAMAVGDENR
jgi:cyclopropane fatty-acyl-phospholipid synthase-like methyltransferase